MAPGGRGQRPGRTRLDLASKNIGIAKDIAANIMQHYNGGVILVVSNPVDIMTYVILKETGLPAGKVIGSGTVLDSARFRYMLSTALGADIRNTHGFMAGGNRGGRVAGGGRRPPPPPPGGFPPPPPPCKLKVEKRRAAFSPPFQPFFPPRTARPAAPLGAAASCAQKGDLYGNAF